MNNRDRFMNYVQSGGKAICSPQIGAGAGFDTKLSGKGWISETTLEDTLAVVERFDMVPMINAGLCDFGSLNPKLVWQGRETQRDDRQIVREYELETPVGTLYRKSVEEKYNSPFLVQYAVSSGEDLDAFEYYLDAAADSDFSYVKSYVENIVSLIDGRGPLSIQWAMQPYELFCFPNTVDTVLLAADYPERFTRLMDKILKLDLRLLEGVAQGGADFVFLGGPGSEMLSPSYYDRFIIPYSQEVTAAAHALGLKIYSHICSPIEPFLTMGYYNRMGIDLFETLSPKPVGNILSLEDALGKISPDICTRGNLGLDVLVNASPKVIKEETFKIMEAAKGRKHIVAASDYLFYQVPEENVHAMCQAVKECDL